MNVKKKKKPKFYFQLHPEKSVDKQVQKYMRAKGCFIYSEFIFILYSLNLFRTTRNEIGRNFEEATAEGLIPFRMRKKYNIYLLSSM